MINLKQLQEDSFASSVRRSTILNSDRQIQQMYKEMHELEDAYLETDVDEFNLPWAPYVAPNCPELTAVEEEWADVLFALLVFAKLENIDIEKALRIKNEFNKTRK